MRKVDALCQRRYVSPDDLEANLRIGVLQSSLVHGGVVPTRLQYIKRNAMYALPLLNFLPKQATYPVG